MIIALTAPEKRSPSGRSNLTEVRHYVIAGFAAVLLLVGGVGGWAATTDLTGAVLAPGTVVVASNVKKIQHPTGGVIGAILVKDGDHVKTGDTLVRLDETLTRASLQLVTKQIDELLGQRARLLAEMENRNDIAFPQQLTARSSDPDIAIILAGENSLFDRRLSARRAELEQLGARISGIREELSGTSAQVAAKSKEVQLIETELASLAGLESRQLVTMSRMLALRREAARLEGENAALVASIGQNKEKIAEIEVQKLGVENQAKSEIAKDLRDVDSKIAEYSERRTAAEDQLRRTELKAPVDGIVDQMSVFTVGGVINPGEQVMIVVPNDDDLVVEAKVRPQDIEDARSSNLASIRLTAFDQRTTPTVEGKVVTVAAEVTREPQSGAAYFIARIAIPEAELKRAGIHRLLAGMPAEVQIRTSPRTALSYLTKPFTDQFALAFKER